MKKKYFIVFFAGVFILFINTSCTKDAPATSSGSVTVTVNPPPPNRPPVANAGVDFSIVLLNNDMILRGQATDPVMGNTLSSSWTKIAGPACTIVSPQSLTTTVSNLLEGEYQFELLVINNQGLTGRDTVTVRTVNVGSLTNFVNFFNLRWYCPMGCTIEIDNIFSQIPPNRPIRVLIKSINQVVWHEVIPISQYSLNNLYYYGFNSNNIYGFNSNNSNTTFWMYSDYGDNNFFDVRIMF